MRGAIVYGKKEWKRILPLLNENKLATEADFIALAAYCQSVDTWVNAEKLKRADGLTSTTSNGTLVQHPAVGIANSAMDKILKFGREFGLTPASRSGLSVEISKLRKEGILKSEKNRFTFL